MAEDMHKVTAAGPRAVIEQGVPRTEMSGDASGPGRATSAQPDAAASAGGFQQATMGFFQGMGRKAWAVADAHPHATLYALVGFVLAVLILVIGLWDTIVIAVFVTLGALLGHMVDNNGGRGPLSGLFGRHR